MTRPDFAGPSVLRVVLAAVVAIDVLSFYAFLGEARTDALANGALFNVFNEFISRPVIRGAIVLVGTAAAVAFARRGRLWEGVVALAALVLLSTAHTQLFGSPWRHLFFGGLCLAGWLLGRAVGRYQGTTTAESYACTGSVALLAAAYLSSGISKVVYGGLTWVSGLPVQSAVVAQNGMVSDGIAAAYRSWVVTTPAVASIFSFATAAFELAAPLMLVGRKTRLVVALGLFGMHLNIYLLTTHILYWESMVLLLAFGLCPYPARSEGLSTAVSPWTRDRPFALAAALLAVCAVFAISHQARRHGRVRDVTPQVVQGLSQTGSAPVAPVVDEKPDSGEPPLPTAIVPVLRQVGPFTTGQKLTEVWSIDSIDLSDEGLTMTILGEPGRARFDLNCSSRASGPFDVGDAHILYSQHVPFEDLQAAGRAVQEELRKATLGHDACERLRAWRTAAQAELSG